MPNSDSDAVALQSAIVCAHPVDATVAIAQGSNLAIYADDDILNISTDHSSSIRAVALSFDGSLIASVGDDKILSISDAKTGELLNKCVFDKKLTSLCFVEDCLIVGDRFGVVYSVANPAAKDAVVTEILGHIETITALCSLPSVIISADIDAKIRCSSWPRSYEIQSFCFGHRGAVTAICPITATTFVSAGEDGTVRLWDAISGQQLALHETEERVPILSIAFGAKEAVLAFIPSNCREVRYFQINGSSFSPVSSLVVDCQPVSLGFAASKLFVGFSSSICSVVLDEFAGREAILPHAVASKYMEKKTKAFEPAPFVFDEISRKKETERRQKKRAKLAESKDADRADQADVNSPSE